VRVERIEGGSGGARVDLKWVLERLGELGITSAMIEAGSQVNAAALGQQLVDKLTLFYAPLFLGPNGVPLVNNVETLKVALTRVSTQQVGRDFRMSGYLRDPWG
jgi:diaminohydroxyphosphoribosylaminopyrimidine deaminase/5-amino-6-(5-phosphoribosylamino)uracil reductase